MELPEHGIAYKKVSGKVYVSFVALIVQSYMLKQLKPYLQKERVPLRKILMELDKMKTIQYLGDEKPRLLNPPTKLQRTIYEMLEIPTEGCIG